jgi:hypothetical protein
LLNVGNFTAQKREVMAVGQSWRPLWGVSGDHRSHWSKEKVNVCYGTHWSQGKLTGRRAISLPYNERLWLLGKVGGRYEGSVGTIKVIDRKKKSMFAMEPIGRWANWLVVGQFQSPSTGVLEVGQCRRSLWGVSGDHRSHWSKKKSVFAMEPIGRWANWLVVGQFQCPTPGGFGGWAMSAIAMRCQWGP